MPLDTCQLTSTASYVCLCNVLFHLIAWSFEMFPNYLWRNNLCSQGPLSDSNMLFFLQNLESLVAQNTTGPVFYPRLYHLMAYVCILMGDGQNCDLFLNTALQLSETQGNVLEKCWLNMSKVGPANQQAGMGMPTFPRKPQKLAAWLGFPKPGRSFWTIPERVDRSVVQMCVPPLPLWVPIDSPSHSHQLQQDLCPFVVALTAFQSVSCCMASNMAPCTQHLLKWMDVWVYLKGHVSVFEFGQQNSSLVCGFTWFWKLKDARPFLYEPSLGHTRRLNSWPSPSSQEWWYSSSELTEDPWLQTISRLPSWEKIVSGKVNMQDIQKNKFLMRVNILDNPF